MSFSEITYNNQIILDTKEEIRDYAFELVLKLVESLGIEQNIPFKKNQITYQKQALHSAGGYSSFEDLIGISGYSYHEIKVLLHEIIHAFSSGRRYDENGGFGAFSQSLVLNEGFTDLLTLHFLNGENFELGNYKENEKKNLIEQMRNNTAKKVKEIKNEYFEHKNELINKFNEDEEREKKLSIEMGLEEDSFTLFLKNTLESHIKSLKSIHRAVVKKIILDNKINENELNNHKQSGNFISNYGDYVFLFEKIILAFSSYYKIEPNIIFKDLQKNYFLGNYDKFVIQLKEVFGNFDEEILKSRNIDDINKIFGFYTY